MIRPTVATVSLSAIQDNLQAIRRMVERETPPQTSRPGIVGVVKANAYGHGAREVGVALEAAGATMLACADIEEGISLRAAGVTVPILIFGALSVSDVSGIFDYNLIPTVSTPSAARALQDAASRRDRMLGCHLKIDTGMNRLGFRHDNLRQTMMEVLGHAHLRIDAVYTHFATADEPESPFFDEQRSRFGRALAALGALGLTNIKRHAANSAAILRDRRTWHDWIRPGLLLYGIVPPPLAAADLGLRPALSLRSRIVAVKGMRPGEGTSYGLRWRADGPTSIAIVPAGYADGLDTRMSGRAPVLVRGRRVPIVGAVCMDMLVIDVSGLDVSPGDEVTIIGQQGQDELTAREIAAAIGTIPWEVVCRLGSRIERRHEP